MSSANRRSGFTLIEMLVTVAVVAILASLVAPSFATALDRARVRSQAANVIDVLEFAKSEAMKRSNVALAINQGASWSVVATVTDSGGNVVATKKAEYDSTNGCTLSTPSSSQSLAFNFRGVISGYVNSDITLESRQGLQVRVAINPIGRISACAVNNALPGYYSSC